MEQHLGNPRADSLLPAGSGDFFKRRFKDLGALALGGLGVAGLMALATYRPGDPSWNSATAGGPENLLGFPGAYYADFMLQGIGLAALAPSLPPLAWSIRLIRKESVSAPWIRLVALALSVLFLSLAAASLGHPDTWPLVGGLGGVLGDTVGHRAILLANRSHPLFPHWAVGFLSFPVGLALLSWSMTLGLRDWIAIHKRTRALFGHFGARGTGFGGTIGNRTRLLARHLPTFNQRPKTAAFFEQAASRTRDVEIETESDVRVAEVPGVVEPRAKRAKPGRKAEAQRQKTFDFADDGDARLPPLRLLNPSPRDRAQGMSERSLRQNAEMLASVLEDFGVKGEIVKVRPGPVVTLYELKPAPGTKTSRVIGLSDDIARSMAALSVRVAVVPGRNAIGIELPNATREMVGFREILGSDDMERAKTKLPLSLGKDIGGRPLIADLARMPHLLVAGTTGSGKSVGINAMILTLLYNLRPGDCRFIMIDPKMLELSIYEGIPHLLCPVVTEPGKAVVALKWTVREMEDRYRAMSQMGVRNIAGYNARLKEARAKGEALTRRAQTGFDEDGKPVFEERPLPMEPLPNIVVIVDEMADLMLVAGKDVEAAIQRLAQMARAAGIHLIMATQRPSVDVITGTIKANFPSRISFQVTSKIDSRTILGEQGAEQLLGQGDMLYMAGGGRITRVHGPFVSDEEVEKVVSFLKTQGSPTYIDGVTEETEDDADAMMPGGGNAGDDLYDQAVALVAREGKASTSFIQRCLQIGYNRAARIVEQMEKEGVVSKADRVGRREVLVGHHGD